jgi:hypothetical protein
MVDLYRFEWLSLECSKGFQYAEFIYILEIQFKQQKIAILSKFTFPRPKKLQEKYLTNVFSKHRIKSRETRTSETFSWIESLPPIQRQSWYQVLQVSFKRFANLR